MGFVDQLARKIEEPSGDASAIADQDRWWSWGRVRATMNSILAEVDDEHDQPRRVGVVLDNRPEAAAAALAVLGSGRCLTVLGSVQPLSALAAQLLRTRPMIMIGSPAALADPAVRAALLAAGCRGVALEPVILDGHVDHRPPAMINSPEDPVLEIASSGTTGPPRSIPISGRQLAAALTASGNGTPPAGQPRTTVIAHPIEHIAGLGALLGAVLARRRVVLLPRFEVESWVRAVATHRARGAFLVPTAIRDLLDSGVPRGELASLSMINTGASHCPPELADQFWRRYGIPVLTTYGATEFAGAVAGWTRRLHAEWWPAKAGSAGRPYSGVSLRITHEDTADELPAGSQGRLEIRSDQATAGDWVRTADLASLDQDGFLWVAGRADAVIDRGGFKISPERIERHLGRHAGVRDSIVVASPDPRLGSVPVAVVECHPDTSRPSEQELIAHCRTRLAPYEVPVRIVFGQLPRGPSGKTLRAVATASINAELITEGATDAAS